MSIHPIANADLREHFARIQADHWARIALVAAAIPSDVDLGDDADVVRALFAAGFCAADFDDVLDEAIERAVEHRREIA